jgi:hypothetical protein
MALLSTIRRGASSTAAGRGLLHGLTRGLATIQVLKAFDRPASLWVRRGVSSPELYYRDPQPVSDADVELCGRLINAYALAQQDGPKMAGMWAHEVFQGRQRRLVDALEAQHPEDVAELLGSMFRAEFVVGMAGGNLGTGRQGRVARRISGVFTLSKLVALAESQGAERAENREHRINSGRGFEGDIGALIEQTEASLGVGLDFPEVGACYGLRIAGRLMTFDSLDQLYAAGRLRAALETHVVSSGPLHIVEIGGGYGCLAYWLERMMDVRYTLVDLPVVNVLQGYFLAKALGAAEVSFYGEQTGRITILPTHGMEQIGRPVDVVINKDSMPEIAEEAALGYLGWISENCDGIFYSYNQEGAVPFDGSPQNVVSEMIARLGTFARVSRDASWLRPGYVEEVYRPAR